MTENTPRNNGIDSRNSGQRIKISDNANTISDQLSYIQISEKRNESSSMQSADLKIENDRLQTQLMVMNNKLKANTNTEE